jgi:hypothetical protein
MRRHMRMRMHVHMHMHMHVHMHMHMRTCGHAGRMAGRAWRSGGGASSAQGGPDCGGGWQGNRGAHVKHLLHGCDAGGVEAQRLVERRHGLPSKRGSIKRKAAWRKGVEKRRRRKQRAREAQIC